MNVMVQTLASLIQICSFQFQIAYRERQNLLVVKYQKICYIKNIKRTTAHKVGWPRFWIEIPPFRSVKVSGWFFYV